MKLGVFRDVEQAIAQASALLGEIVDYSEEGTPFAEETMKREWPELRRAVNNLYRSIECYNRSRTLSNAEEVLTDAEDLCDKFDPEHSAIPEDDIYYPPKLQAERPKLWAHMETLKGALNHVKVRGWAE